MKVIFGGLLLFMLSAGACTKYPPADGLSVNAEMANLLMEAPESVNIEGKDLILTTDLWRDFMPGVGEMDKSLRIAASISEKSGSEIPAGLEFKRLIVLNSDSIWSQSITNSERSSKLKLMAAAKGGPEWKIDSEVAVITEFTYNEKSYKLRTSGVITATY